MKQNWRRLKWRKGWFHILTYISWILRMKQLFLRVALNYQIKTFQSIKNILYIFDGRYTGVWYRDITKLNIIQRHNFFQSFASIGHVDLVWWLQTSLLSLFLVLLGWDFNKLVSELGAGQIHCHSNIGHNFCQLALLA